MLAGVGVVALAIQLLGWLTGRDAASWTALAVVAALAVVGPVWWWLNRWFFRPLRETADGARRLAAGDLDHRVVVPEAAELATVARSVNLLADDLGDQVRLLDAERERFKEVATREMAGASRLTEVRRDLVANVSHELKTPLTAIRGYAETLEDGALDRRRVARRFTRSILEQCARLEALLGDLLTLSRLDSQQRAPEPEAVDLAELARHAVEVLAPRARKGDLELTLEAPDAVPAVGERDELERLLLNLIENAIKYNRPGGRVRVRLDARDSELIIEVRDSGIGIPEEALERVFERFYRVDKGRSRDQGGTGLGLAIIKHVAQSHGGSIEVESKLGHGSTFIVRLPAILGAHP